jgi:DNA mismatch repair protein MSH2
LQELEDILFSNADMEDSQVMVALKLSTEKGATVIGAAYCDVLLKKIGVSEFVDNDHMSNLEVRPIYGDTQQ